MVTEVRREIGPKGKGYLLLSGNPREEAEIEEELTTGVERLRHAGAQRIFAASTVPGMPLRRGSKNGLSLVWRHDMIRMERELAGTPAPRERPELRPLAAADGAAYCERYNRAFFDVPNSATYGPEEIREMTAGGRREGGFAWADGRILGVYELDFCQKLPELAGIAVAPEYQGRGLGRALLLTLMDELRRRGSTRCFLIVSTANQTACRLYRSVGFCKIKTLSQWYEVTYDVG